MVKYLVCSRNGNDMKLGFCDSLIMFDIYQEAEDYCRQMNVMIPNPFDNECYVRKIEIECDLDPVDGRQKGMLLFYPIRTDGYNTWIDKGFMKGKPAHCVSYYREPFVIRAKCGSVMYATFISDSQYKYMVENGTLSRYVDYVAKEFYDYAKKHPDEIKKVFEDKKSGRTEIALEEVVDRWDELFGDVMGTLWQ